MSNPGVISNSQPEPSYGGSGWGKVVPPRDFKTPSGALALVKDITIEEMVELGVLDKLDSFGAKVLPKEPGKKGAKSEKTIEDQIKKDPKKMFTIFEAIDAVVITCVVKPELTAKPPKLEDGSDGPLDETKNYIHLVPMEDRAAIFEEVTPDMTSFFRSGGKQTAGVADLPDVEEPGEDAS